MIFIHLAGISNVALTCAADGTFYNETKDSTALVHFFLIWPGFWSCHLFLFIGTRSTIKVLVYKYSPTNYHYLLKITIINLHSNEQDLLSDLINLRYEH